MIGKDLPVRFRRPSIHNVDFPPPAHAKRHTQPILPALSHLSQLRPFLRDPLAACCNAPHAVRRRDAAVSLHGRGNRVRTLPTITGPPSESRQEKEGEKSDLALRVA
jgi:hypothetical protein